ncbi:fas-associated death domain protein [Battus philenor]|uniref:fas-associated death domain protein n=1 Tax=Battus philenor TaxID=42288 RepID=UPI0035D084AD
MTATKYSHLKNQIVLSAGQSDKHAQMLSTLKEYYKDEIDSPRRYENINSIGQLLKILEIRDVLSEDDVNPLKEIVSRLPNNRDLLRKIENYESTLVPMDCTNYYVVDRHKNKSFHEPIESINNNPCGSISKKKMERIYTKIQEEIGTFWRDLARNLKIRECDIDDIDNTNTKISQKVSKLLDIYEYRADPQRWFFVLCDALEKSRRKDLSRSLQEIMSMNI